MISKFGIVYKIEDLVTGKIYIGQTTRSLAQRLREHKRTPLIKAVLDKDMYTAEVLFIAFCSKGMNRAEKYFINFYGCLHPNGLNLKNGGVIGSSHCEKSRIKNSRALGGDYILAINPKTREYVIYSTQHETTKDGFDVRNVNAVLKDKGNRPTHNGWIFKYLKQVNQSGSTENKSSGHAQRLVVDPYMIDKIIEDYKTTTSDRHPNKTLDNAVKIKNLFSEGFSAFAISKELNVNKKSILRFLKDNNLGRTHTESQQNRRRMMR